MASSRHYLFVSALVAGHSATEAAAHAGYSRKTAAQQASRLLRNVQVKALLATERKRVAAQARVDAQWIIDRLIEVIDWNPSDIIGFDEEGFPFLKPEGVSLLKHFDELKLKTNRSRTRRSMKLKVKTADRLKAIELLMTLLGLDQTCRSRSSQDPEFDARVLTALAKHQGR